ncbi:caspase-3-like isoform X2 [Rana temporaria]|uniref:caspase-3-like isoform X2 n=1 Tax=Rana temporaria TaxID=8407 RepID=UPI001AACFFBE|nr:caspase-3-like isoform X2 [Rana temporaria]
MAEEGHSFQNVTEPSDSNRKNDSITRDEDPEDIEKYKYKMDYPEKGLCVIINIESLHPVAKEDHSQRGCFVCVVLSHGKDGGFYLYDDFMTEEYLFNLVKGESCKQLVGKPKLFFIQACRGFKRDSGVTPYASIATTSTGKIPIEADFLYHYSTCQGYVSFRNTFSGSWFIQSLCEMLKKYGKKYELMQILTRVNHKVAFEYEANKEKEKEMPCIVSKLTKDVYL